MKKSPKKRMPASVKRTQKNIPVTRPTLEPFDAYAPLFRETLRSGMLTTHNHVREFESRTAKYLGVKHCVAVSSCTAGLMLVLQGLNLKGEVIVPSFTFAASAHALMWCGLTPVFADIDANTYTIDPAAVERAITPRTSAILATHVFGVMCDVSALQKIARKHKLKLIFDAAHAFGASYKGGNAGNFGDAEVFSLSPIKVLTAAEGGLVATNNDSLAQYVRMGRNYGDNGTNDMQFVGLSARMSELHAAVGLRSLAKLSTNLKNRANRAQYLMTKLQAIEPNVRFQFVPAHITTTRYVLSAYIDPHELGYNRDMLHAFFAQHDIRTRKYFYPPLHTQTVYGRFAKRGAYPITDQISSNVLSLPLYSHMSKNDMDRIVNVFRMFTSQQKKHA
jgi:dTDP-4-amino-4,6-dideoxygalactose transaminase